MPVSRADIPADKPIWISLTYIYGVGRTNSRQMLKEAGIDGQRARRPDRRRAGQDHRTHRQGLLVEAPRRSIQQNIARRRDIGSYRGHRHRRALPVRGQAHLLQRPHPQRSPQDRRR